MSDFENQISDQPSPLGSRPNRGRRAEPVDWDRINGDPIVPPRGFFGWIGYAVGKLIKWILMLIMVPLICYLVAGGVGAWLPVNEDFTPAHDGVEVFIYSGTAHSEFILPIKTNEKDWTAVFQAPSSPDALSQEFTHVAIGWGDKELYTQTQQWSDLDAAIAAKALFLPTDSVVHAQWVSAPYTSSRSMRTKISPQQYTQLCQFIESTLADANPMEGVAFGDNDHFYAGTGQYHLFNTCNNWVGEAMKAAGIKVGRFTPLPKTVFWHLNN